LEIRYWALGIAYAVQAEDALGVDVVAVGAQVEGAGALFQAVGRDLAVGQRAAPG
jgi:hypothetical protein